MRYKQVWQTNDDTTEEDYLVALAEKHVLVVVPTFNEAGNINMLLDRLFGLNIPTLHVLIVDDNSPDGTAALVAQRSLHEPRLHLLPREKKMGLGTAYVAGFKFALQNGFDLIFEMDADLSHNPEDLPRFLSKSKEFDLIIGSRYLTGVNVTNWPLGLQPSLRQLQFLQAGGERYRRGIARAARRVVLQADVDQAVEKGARGQNDRSAAKADT